MTDQRPHILIIDDAPANLLMLGSALAADFQLRVATSGAMGLALAAELPPDLILLDVMMPEMDGYETCRRLKADPQLKSIPVIFVTALTDPSAEAAGLGLGAADFITKPINVEIARHRIRNLLERERLRKEVENQRDVLRSLYNSLQTVREEERHNFARELHDNQGHLITALSMDLGWIEARLPPLEPHVAAKLGTLAGQIEQIVDANRNLIEALRPGMLDTLGLGRAIENYVSKFSARTGIKATFIMDPSELEVGEKISIGFFRIMQEALNNVAKHASATHVSVSLKKGDDSLVLIVEDNGKGMPETAKSGNYGFGILGMGERVAILNGKLSISNQAGRGVRVEVVVPT